MRTQEVKDILNRIFSGNPVFNNAPQTLSKHDVEFLNKNITLQDLKPHTSYKIVEVFASRGIFVLFGVYYQNNVKDSGFICLLDENFEQMYVSWTNSNKETIQTRTINEFEYITSSGRIFKSLPPFEKITQTNDNTYFGYYWQNNTFYFCHFNDFTRLWYDEVYIYNTITSFEINNTLNFNDDSITRVLNRAEIVNAFYINENYYIVGVFKTIKNWNSYRDGKHPEVRELFYVKYDTDLNILTNKIYTNIINDSLISIKEFFLNIDGDEIDLIYFNQAANRIFYQDDRSFEMRSRSVSLTSKVKYVEQLPYPNFYHWETSPEYLFTDLKTQLDARYFSEDSKYVYKRIVKTIVNGYSNTYDYSSVTITQSIIDLITYLNVVFKNNPKGNYQLSPDIRTKWDQILYPSSEFEHWGTGVKTFTRNFTTSVNVQYIWRYDFTPIFAVNSLKINRDDTITFRNRIANVEQKSNVIFRANKAYFGALHTVSNSTKIYVYDITQNSFNTIVEAPYNNICLQPIQKISNIYFVGAMMNNNIGYAFATYTPNLNTTNYVLSQPFDGQGVFKSAVMVQQNKIIILNYDERFSKCNKTYISYNGSFSTSDPYFFDSYLNDEKALKAKRFQFFNNNILVADIDINDSAINNNIISMSGRIDEKSLNSNFATHLKVIGLTGLPIIEKTIDIRKTYFIAISYNYNYSLFFKTRNLITNEENTKTDLSHKLIGLYGNEVNARDLIDQLKIARVDFYYNNNSGKFTYDITPQDYSYIDGVLTYEMDFFLEAFVRNDLTLSKVEVTNAYEDNRKIIYYKEDYPNKIDLYNSYIKVKFDIVYENRGD